MNKILVLDTSVLVYDAKSLYSFDNVELVLPIVVLEELDKLKTFMDQVGRNARTFIKTLDAISNDGNTSEGIQLDNNILFKIDTIEFEGNGDGRILACAIKIKKDNPDKEVCVVSRDINLRVRAKAAGLQAIGYNKTEITTDDLYVGHREIISKTLGNKLNASGVISAHEVEKKIGETISPNEFVLFVDQSKRGLAAGRKIGTNIHLVSDKTPWGLKVRNKEQLFAVDLLLDTSVPLVSIIGAAGGGKTLCALAAGLELVLNQNKYNSLIIYRPIQTVGPDIGFLPGSAEEKIAPFYGPINDAFSFLLSDKSRKKDGWKAHLFQYLSSGVIQQEALAFIRGRSIHNSLVLVDEAQNLSKEDMKTILTRIGENSKIIFCGDIEQIDAPRLDAINNGLTYAVNTFRNYDLAGHITLHKGERSALASLAAKLL